MGKVFGIYNYNGCIKKKMFDKDEAVTKIQLVLSEVQPPFLTEEIIYKEFSKRNKDKLQNIETLRVLKGNQNQLERVAMRWLMMDRPLYQCFLGVAAQKKIIDNTLLEKVLRDANTFQECLGVEKSLRIDWREIVEHCEDKEAIAKKLETATFECDASNDIRLNFMQILTVKK